jgi:hypothetical protein
MKHNKAGWAFEVSSKKPKHRTMQSWSIIKSLSHRGSSMARMAIPSHLLTCCWGSDAPTWSIAQMQHETSPHCSGAPGLFVDPFLQPTWTQAGTCTLLPSTSLALFLPFLGRAQKAKMEHRSGDWRRLLLSSRASLVKVDIVKAWQQNFHCM